MTVAAAVRRLWLSPSAFEARAGDTDILVVLDPTWTPGEVAGARPAAVPVRDTLEATLQVVDPIVETSEALDAWALAAGVVDAMAIGGTSIWYYRRLHHWQWLQERILWAHVLERLLTEHRPGAIACGPGVDQALVEVAGIMAGANGMDLRVDDSSAGDDEGAAGRTAVAGPADGRSPAATASPSLPRRWARRIRQALRQARGKPPTIAAELKESRQRDAELTARLIEERLDCLGREPERRLLVVLNHHAQRVETAHGPRLMNPYLGTVADRLAGTTLEPIFLDARLRGLGQATRARMGEPGAERLLPLDAIRTNVAPAASDVAQDAAACARIAAVEAPIPVCGIDLGPILAAHVAEDAARWLPAKRSSIARLRALLARLHPAGILLADEYHRQDWMEAAREAGVPVTAIQHGTIYRHHRGYIHGERPPRLQLPTRTYVYGRWERDLLVRGSVYREDEVMVGGSPRLDLDRPDVVDREAVRAELDIAPDDRLLVLSGTYGGIYRAFHYPVALARVFDRPLPRIHLVVKQHPAEEDEGPYRAVIEGVAAAGGFAPPPISIVRDVDLYRLLRAADAHLGIHSTVLTEAVFVGTPNLLATSVLGGDLLDYVASGVAVPVANGADLLAAIDAATAGGTDEASRAAFLAQHFEPGSAATRIADDLLALLAGP